MENSGFGGCFKKVQMKKNLFWKIFSVVFVCIFAIYTYSYIQMNRYLIINSGGLLGRTFVFDKWENKAYSNISIFFKKKSIKIINTTK
jgi:hypothetical protein